LRNRNLLALCTLTLLASGCRRATDDEYEQGKLLRDTLEQAECATQILSDKEEHLAMHVHLRLSAMEHQLADLRRIRATTGTTTDSGPGRLEDLPLRIDIRKRAPDAIANLNVEIAAQIAERRRIAFEIANRTAQVTSPLPLAVKKSVQDDFNEGVKTLQDWQSQLEQLSVAIQLQNLGITAKELEETRAALQTNGYVVNSLRNSIRLLREQLRLDPGNSHMENCIWDTTPSQSVMNDKPPANPKE